MNFKSKLFRNTCKILSLLIIVMAFVGCSKPKNAEEPQIKEDEQALIDVTEEYNFTEEFVGEGTLSGFSFKYPSTWTNEGLSEDVEVQQVFIIDELGSNLNIIGVNVKSEDMDILFNETVKLTKDIYGLDEVKTETTEINGCKVNSLEYAVDYEGMKLNMIQYQISKGDKVFAVTMGSIITGDAVNIDIINEFKNVMNTININ